MNVEELFNEVVLVWSNNPSQGTAGVYIDGELMVTFDERGARRPSTDHIRKQAERHVLYKEHGNALHEINHDWPLPPTLTVEELESDKPVKPAGKPNDNFDQDAKRTED